MPKLSDYFLQRKPSPVRLAQITFNKRLDKVDPVNVAIGNVRLPLHKEMQKRLNQLVNNPDYAQGIVDYSPSAGTKEAQSAFLKTLTASNLDTNGLNVLVTEGGSLAMEIVVVGVSDPMGNNSKPIMLIDPAYSNYGLFAKRTNRKVIAFARKLKSNGKFTLPELTEIEKIIIKEKPSALVVIPYDNPTGQHYTQEQLQALAKLCVKYDLWLISDEAYRELFYDETGLTSVWKLTENEVPGITGRRISIESSSKVWNGCGLRIGALITDNKDFYDKSVAENTANLCANSIGQYIFSAINDLSIKQIQEWFKQQRDYYKQIATSLINEFENELPQAIVSQPESALYTVVDLRELVSENFSSGKFVLYCSEKGLVEVDGEPYTLLTAPMEGFYMSVDPDPGKTQLRISFVETPERMLLIPRLLKVLLSQYTDTNP